MAGSVVEQLSDFYAKRTGYATEIGTRPQTLYGVADSPVGLAAWILDHDPRSYENISHLFDGRPFGDLTRDDILDNITLYWFTNTGISSGRLYWENKFGFFDWDTQMLFFLQHGYRVIAHDRRGYGRSSQTSDGHDMDHYADDLAALTAHLDLTEAIHVGHSTGGGEVIHYLAGHGESRVAKAAIISAVPPLMVETESNPGGLPKEVFDGFQAQLAGASAHVQVVWARRLLCQFATPARIAHHARTQHPLVRSFEPGEDWFWCYPEQLAFEVPTAGPAPSHS